MASISCNEAASELLRQCLTGERWDESLVERLVREECSDALFRIVAEGLADRFERRLCDKYAAIFSRVIESAMPQYRAGELQARYERVREPRVCHLEPQRVAVLSRVTLGADIAVTSAILDAAKRRFPKAEIVLAGSRKAAELFAMDPRIGHLDGPYARFGTLAERLQAGRALAGLLDDERTIVIDPDSRLTQLGLLPVCSEGRYFFFESRSYGGDGRASLADLTKRWVAETFGVGDARHGIAPPFEPFEAERPQVAVSLGTGGSTAKGMIPEFEAGLVRLLTARFRTVVVDRGFGPEELERVERAIAGSAAQTWSGNFARFASLISQSDCYVGYDSAGQHAASAAGTPLVTLFKGFASERMFQRWQPSGSGPKQVLKVVDALRLGEVGAALDKLGFFRTP